VTERGNVSESYRKNELHRPLDFIAPAKETNAL
jgi:hypothetical protein